MIIADFGLSRVNINEDLYTTLCGTAYTMAPEVLSCKNYTTKADIWSAAVIMLEIYLSQPFPSIPARPAVRMSRNSPEWLRWSRLWEQRLVNALHHGQRNDAVVDILKAMLDPDSEERYSAEECLELGCHKGLFEKNRRGRL